MRYIYRPCHGSIAHTMKNYPLWKALVALFLITNGIVFVAVAGRLLSETKTVAVPDSSQVMIPSRLRDSAPVLIDVEGLESR